MLAYRLARLLEEDDGGVRDLDRVRVRVRLGETEGRESRLLRSPPPDRPFVAVARLLERERDRDLEYDLLLGLESRRESSLDLVGADLLADFASDDRDDGGVVFDDDNDAAAAGFDDSAFDLLELVCDLELDLESSPLDEPCFDDGVFVDDELFPAAAFSALSFSFSFAF